MQRAVVELPELHGELRPSIGTERFLRNLEIAANHARTAQQLLGSPVVGTTATQQGIARDVLWLDEFVSTARAATSQSGRLDIVDFGSSDRSDAQSMLEDIADRFAEKREYWHESAS
jgi:hypothetical protein